MHFYSVAVTLIDNTKIRQRWFVIKLAHCLLMPVHFYSLSRLDILFLLIVCHDRLEIGYGFFVI